MRFIFVWVLFAGCAPAGDGPSEGAKKDALGSDNSTGTESTSSTDTETGTETGDVGEEGAGASTKTSTTAGTETLSGSGTETETATDTTPEFEFVLPTDEDPGIEPVVKYDGKWLSGGLLANVNWGAAGAACDSLTYGGESDWRLPTRPELEALHDAGLWDRPELDTSGYWPNYPYWTGTVSDDVVDPDEHWTYRVAAEEPDPESKSPAATSRYQCIRGG